MASKSFSAQTFITSCRYRLRAIYLEIKYSRLLIYNGTLLIINTITNSLFGFAFWIICARIFTKELVGMGASYVAALTFITSLGEFGLGTALIRFAPLAGNLRDRFINTIFWTLLTTTTLSALLFLVGTPLWLPDLVDIIQSPAYIIAFVVSTAFFALGMILDRLFVAFQEPKYMLVRNLVANSARILLLVWMARRLGALIFLLSIGGGALLSLILSQAILLRRSVPDFRLKPELHWQLLQDKIGYSIGNHLSNILWNAPPLIYPLVIVNLLGTEANAQFYVTWMIANILFILPTSFATAVFANAANHDKCPERLVWKTMTFSIGAALPGIVILIVGLKPILSLFGKGYVESGESLLFWLALSVIPYTINSFIITYYRIHLLTRSVVLVSSFISILSFTLIVLLGHSYHLPGIGTGWFMGQTVGSLCALLYYGLLRRHEYEKFS